MINYIAYNIDVITGTHTVAEIAYAIMDDQSTFRGFKRPANQILHDITSKTFELQSKKPIKWPDETGDMKAFSKRFPTAIFIIKGFDEKGLPIWEHRYTNGKMKERHVIRSWSTWGAQD